MPVCTPRGTTAAAQARRPARGEARTAPDAFFRELGDFLGDFSRLGRRVAPKRPHWRASGRAMPEVEEISTEAEEPSEKTYVPGSHEDLARFYEKVGCTEAEALTRKHLEWGWKDLGPEDGAALAHVIKSNKTCITLECAARPLARGAHSMPARTRRARHCRTRP